MRVPLRKQTALSSGWQPPGHLNQYDPSEPEFAHWGPELNTDRDVEVW